MPATSLNAATRIAAFEPKLRKFLQKVVDAVNAFDEARMREAVPERSVERVDTRRSNG